MITKEKIAFAAIRHKGDIFKEDTTKMRNGLLL
jgi:hypothetical protein